MAKEGLTKKENIRVKAREIDFVTRFSQNWEHLREILGVSRPIKKAPGTMLTTKRCVGRLASGIVAEGEDIPYSKFEIDEIPYEKIIIEKYAKGVSLEAIDAYGYETAVQRTDDEFLFELQTNVTNKFYSFLATGEIRKEFSTYQRSLSMAKGLVANKFRKMHKTATGFVGFVNELDVAQYLGDANITMQTKYGFTYIKDFLNFNTLFVLGDDEVPQGKIFATAVDNLLFYYVDPADSEYAKAGFEFTTVGETPLLGIHTEADHHKLVSESIAITGVTLMAEYIDAVAVVTCTGITPIIDDKVSRSELMDMTKAEIQELATEKGYTITATDKAGMIEQFLEEQAKA